jgi:hypothetical protein
MVYFMARILDLACQAKLKDELLHCMQIKIIRRLQKLFSAEESILWTGKSSDFL